MIWLLGVVVDVMLLRAHQRQVAHQCRVALNAVGLINAALKAQNQEVFWAGMQNFLTAAANIAKECWGAGGKLDEERRPLRESLSVKDGSALASTDLRNHLEHYDERVDRWYKNSKSHNFVDFYFGPIEGFEGADPTDMFRAFDPSKMEVVFWGEHYSIPPIVSEINRLLTVAEKESKKPHWNFPESP